jgi:hypothetical protein
VTGFGRPCPHCGAHRVWSLDGVGPEIHWCAACGGAVKIERSVSGLEFEPIEWPSPADDRTNQLIATAIMGVRESPGPPYSSDLAAAWHVVERLEDLGWWLDLRRFADDPAIAWAATFRIEDGREVKEPGPTPALAICRAAIRSIFG